MYVIVPKSKPRLNASIVETAAFNAVGNDKRVAGLLRVAALKRQLPVTR